MTCTSLFPIVRVSPKKAMHHLLPNLYTVLMSEEKSFSSTSDWLDSKQGLSLDSTALSSSLRKTNCPLLWEANKSNIINHMTLIRISSSHHHITSTSPAFQFPHRHQLDRGTFSKGQQNKTAFASWLLSSDMSVSLRDTLAKLTDLQCKYCIKNTLNCPELFTYRGLMFSGLTWALWTNPISPLVRCFPMKMFRALRRNPSILMRSPWCKCSSSLTTG